MLGFHGSIVIPQNTPYAEEMRKHESHHTTYGPPGRPYPYHPGDEKYEFPRRIYKAVRADEGGIRYDGFTVADETEQGNMLTRGYSLTQAAALEALEREQAEHGKLAAERNWEIQAGRISEKAAAEVRAAEAEHGARHLPEVPAIGVRK